MTVRIATGRSDIIFDISDGQNFRITKISSGHSETLVYGSTDCYAAILNELEWLIKYHPGIFRLLWMYAVPWSEISEIFVHYAQSYGVSL